MGWFNKNSKEDNSIEHLTLKIQKGITIFTFLVFFLLIGIYFFSIIKLPNEKIELSLRALNVFLPIITSWIGAIIAFYFSKEFSDALVKKIKVYQRTQKEVTEKINTLETSYKREKEELAKEYQSTIFDLINQLNKGEKAKNDKRKR